MNIIERVQEEMISDVEDTDEQSSLLIQTYQNASPATREVVDEIFACLCGYRLSTLLRGATDNDVY